MRKGEKREYIIILYYGDIDSINKIVVGWGKDIISFCNDIDWIL